MVKETSQVINRSTDKLHSSKPKSDSALSDIFRDNLEVYSIIVQNIHMCLLSLSNNISIRSQARGAILLAVQD